MQSRIRAPFSFLVPLLAAFLLVGAFLRLPVQAEPASSSADSSAPGEERTRPTLIWRDLAPGLQLATLERQPPDSMQVTVLRIDPAAYDFILCSSAFSDRETPRTINEWMEKHDLAAAINASMYLPDGQTSTAYMRRGQSVNNGRVATKYGGFFVSAPRVPGLPEAAILDKYVDDWESLLPNYDTVVQNMRLLGSDGTQLWPENGPVHAVAAIGQDGDGRILFLHCASQISVNKLAGALLDSDDLDLVAAIYVEGGSQTALSIRLPDLRQTWTGRSPADVLLRGQIGDYRLPNIIGIRAK